VVIDMFRLPRRVHDGRRLGERMWWEIMSERHVVPNRGPEGGWKIVTPDSDTAQRLSTQADAIEHAMHSLDSGGEVVIYGIDGRVRDRRTIPAPRQP
jgi:hypothetical protein